MPKVAEPPKVETPPNRVQVAGKQEHFQRDGFELAARVGFTGEPHLQTASGLRVDDAQNFCVKVLHEHYQAGAKGERQPDCSAACGHLGVDDADEMAAIGAALTGAYEAGKGATLTEHDVRTAHMTAGLVMTQLGAERAAKAAGEVV